jgi:uncharacterized membrane protein
MAGSLADEVLPPLTTEDKMLSGLCYPFWVAVPWFVLASPKREDPFLCFHALQGLALGVAGTILTVVSLPFLWLMFNSLPTTYTMTAGFLGVFILAAALAWMGVSFAVLIFMGWQASSGRFLRFPWLGEFCEARVGKLLDVDAERLHQLAVDRELEPEEKVTVIAAIHTPEQLQAEVDQWAKPLPASWWGGEQKTPAEAAVPPSVPPRAAAAEPARVQFPQANPAPAAEPSRVQFPPAHPPTAAQPSRVQFPAAQAPARPGGAPPAAQRPAADGEARPWRPAAAAPPSPPAAPPRPAEPEVKPWRPAAASATPQAKPVSFPSVARPGSEAARPEEAPKWWKPKE